MRHEGRNEPRVKADTFLDQLPGHLRERLLGLGSPVRYVRGQELLAEGERTTFVVVILAGVVKVTAFAGKGREALLAIRASGDVVGELASMDGSPRSATVTACGRVEGRWIGADEFRAFLGDDPEASMTLNAVVADRLRSANQHRLDFLGRGLKARLARILLELDRRYGLNTVNGRVLAVRLTQPELASLAGVASVTVQRPLRELRQAGLIATGRGRFRLLDLPGLRLVAKGP